MNYYEIACMMIGNLFFLMCGVFVGFFAVYGTYQALSRIPLWGNRNMSVTKEKTRTCEYGKYKYQVSYFPVDDFGKTTYVTTIFDLQTRGNVQNMIWFSDLKTANKRFKKICRDFNKCAPWVVAMVDSQISRSKMDV